MNVYHLLPEVEPFSEYFGGALSRWAGNVLKNDPGAVIVAPWSDDTWKFEAQRVRPVRKLRLYGDFVKACRHRVPAEARKVLAGFSLRKIFEQAAPTDVVYVHNRPEFAAAIQDAYPRRRFKLVLHMHNSHLLYAPKQFAKCADLTAFCSAFLRDEAQQAVGAIRSAVIPNGADAECFFPGRSASCADFPTVLFVGRLIEEKGPHVLIEAMRILQREGIQARAVIVGGASFGPAQETAYTRRLKSEAPSNVEFSPYVTGAALAEHFRAASVFCCPSVFEEPFGMVNVEAMASGVAVVATRVGGIPEIFAEGGGLLVAPADPAELAGALKTLLRDPMLRERLAGEGRRSFQRNFTWEAVRGKYHQALAQLGTAELAA